MNEPTNDIERMLRPNLWPNRPLLPMKKYDARQYAPFPVFGIYCEDGLFVEGIDIFTAAANPDRLKSLAVRHVTPGQLIEEGWQID